MSADENDAIIVRSTIDLAHNIGLKVVGEGVEDRTTYDILASLNCDLVQGYYMATPLSSSELIDWLKTSPWGLNKDKDGS